MNRILIVLPNWYGETLFATPFLKALRTQRPEAFIATLGWPKCRDVLMHNPHVDECIDYEEDGAHQRLGGKWRLVNALHAQRFDTVFVLRKSLSRSVLVWLAGISVRVGFANPKSGWLLTHAVVPSIIPTHKAFTYLPLLEAVGLTGVRSAYEYTVGEAERQAAAAWRRAQSPNGRPVVILHPGANWPHKQWPPEHCAELADRLIEQHQVHMVITGGPDDISLAQQITCRMRHPAAICAGQTTLRQLAAQVEQSQLVVSNDTGVLHIAAALSRPIVALYGPTSPALTGPLGDPRRMIVIHHSDCCPMIPCYQAESPAHLGMAAISVDEVALAAERLLQSTIPARS